MCVLIADFITGLFHWAEDTYGTIDDTWFSKYIWEPNIMHHKHPSDIAKNSFLDRNIIQWVIAALFIGLYAIFFPITWQLILIGILASFGNEIHVWSHRKTNPWWIELLQDMCIIQTKLHHAKHHLKPYSTRYCVITNIVNPILETIRFWESLEWVLSPIITPKRGMPGRQGF